METIKSAAIRDQYGAVHTLPPPAHHKQVIGAMRVSGNPVKGAIKGFLTSEGRFVGREQAGRIAVMSAQATTMRFAPELHSGDMW